MKDNVGLPGHGREVFVGRQDLLASILRAVDPRGGKHEWAVGTWGTGKTALRRRAATLLAQEKNAVVLDFDASHCVFLESRGLESTASMETLYSNYRTLCDLVLAAVGRCRELDSDAVQGKIAESDSALKSQILALSQPVNVRVDVRARGDVTASGSSSIGSVYVNEDVKPLARIAIADAVTSLIDDLTSMIMQVSTGRPLVVMIDGYDSIAAHPVANWLTQLTARLPKSTALIYASAPQSPASQPGDLTLELRPFSTEEVREYITARLGPRQDLAVLAADVMRASEGGIPYLVAMAVDILDQRTGSVLTLGEVPLEVHGLFEEIVDEVPDSLVTKVLLDGRLARRLDRGVIQYLLYGKDDPSDQPTWERAGDVVASLKRYSFVEPIRVPYGHDTFTLRRYVRDTLLQPSDDLRVDCEEVHRKLAALWRSRRRRIERRFEEEPERVTTRSSPRVYSEWYVYETDEWQAATLEAFYHAAKTSGSAHITALLDLADVFFRLFWWFGCYAPFPYCAKLLDSWEAAHPGSDSPLTIGLRRFAAEYPPGWSAGGGQQWRSTRRALLDVRQMLDLDNPSRLNPAAEFGNEPGSEPRLLRQSVRALTSLFLAHTYKFGDGKTRCAISLFDDAIRWFSVTEDALCALWTRFEKAELLLQLEDLDEARRLYDEVVVDLASEGLMTDHELIANLHRLRAQIAVAANESGISIAVSAAKSLLHAYAFLVDPHGPDPYVLQFYDEIRIRTAEIFIALAALRGPEATRAALLEFQSSMEAVLHINVDLLLHQINECQGPHERIAVAESLSPPSPHPDDVEEVDAVREFCLEYNWQDAGLLPTV